MSSAKSEVRVRFAPSPTGFLHVGGARTALFNYLYARAHGGKFLLRIEDTDKERSEERFTQDILESLKWMGLLWDEEPIFQSQRTGKYREAAEKLVAEGKAFRCGYSQEELDAIKEKCRREKRPYRYPGFDPKKVSDAPDAPIRLKMPRIGETGFDDLIRGRIVVPNTELDDWIIFRSNGMPTYNFCVVLDDADQGITHILRGEDHINNTPKQLHVYRALGLPEPQFGHVPMILGQDKAKLSKRHGAASTLEYRKMGYLPSALINFLVRLGWSHGDQELFSLEELERLFNLESVGRSNAVFNTEKLDWVSGKWMERTPTPELCAYLQKYFSEQLTPIHRESEQTLQAAVALIQGKVKTVLELIDQLLTLFGPDPEQYPVDSLKQKLKEGMPEVLIAVHAALEGSNFSVSDVEARIRGVVEELNLKFGQVGQSVRFAVTGGKVSPELFDMLSLQGKERVLRRLLAAREQVVSGPKPSP